MTERRYRKLSDVLATPCRVKGCRAVGAPCVPGLPLRYDYVGGVLTHPIRIAMTRPAIRSRRPPRRRRVRFDDVTAFPRAHGTNGGGGYLPPGSAGFGR